jgi:hypothetical protein
MLVQLVPPFVEVQTSPFVALSWSTATRFVPVASDATESQT